MAIGDSPLASQPFGASGHSKSNKQRPSRNTTFDSRALFDAPTVRLPAESSRSGQLITPNTNGTSEPAQQTDMPGLIDVAKTLSEAKERLDASARNGHPWAVITCDEHGKAHGLPESLQPAIRQHFEKALRQDFRRLHLPARINGGKVLSKPRPQDDINSSIESSRRSSNASLVGKRLKEWIPVTPEAAAGDRTTESSRSKKRGAISPASVSSSPTDEDGDEPVAVMQTKRFRLDDDAELEWVYRQTFKFIQQLALKDILKAWIKEIEPHKQKNFPYKQKVRTQWWPSQVKFTEPDHLQAWERTNLALAIINYVQTEPRFESKGISILEQSTQRIALEYDQPADKVTHRLTLLKQLYSVARMEEQVKNKERDPDEIITVYDLDKPVKTKGHGRKRIKTLPTQKNSPKVDESTTPRLGITDITKFDIRPRIPNVSSSLSQQPPVEQRRTPPTDPPENVSQDWLVNSYEQQRHNTITSYFNQPPDNASTCDATVFNPFVHAQQQDQQYTQLTGRFPSFSVSTLAGQASISATASPRAQDPATSSFDSASASVEHISWIFPDATPVANFPTHGLPESHIPIATTQNILPDSFQQQTATVYTASWSDEQRWQDAPGLFAPPNDFVP